MKSAWIVLCLVGAATAVDYCRLNCNKQTHTMCLYKSSSPADACKKVISTTLTKAEKDELVRTHNSLRAKVASGSEKRGKPGPQPPATNMKKMSWDDELAVIAQRWADQCHFGHDACRNVERFPAGQNVAMKAITAANTYPMSSYVQSWYDEVELFDSRQVPHVTNFEGTGHYTQLVWADSVKLGCGVVRYIDPPNWNTTYLVCNYGPAGNWVGEALYKTP